MPVVHNPSSAYSKEIATWDRKRSQLDDDGRPGMRPDRYEHFPLMLYRAIKLPSGKHVCQMPYPASWECKDDKDYERQCLMADSITKANQRIVKSEREEADARRDGWRESPQAAMDFLAGLEIDIANAAAEAQFSAQRMSGKAKDELERAEQAAGPDHAPDVPAPKLSPKGTRVA